MLNAFSRNIKAIREDNSISQEELAERLAVTRQTVGRWESGEVAQPRIREVTEKIKELFSVTETDLFGTSDGYYAKRYNLTSAPAGAIAAKKPRRAYAPLLGRVHAGEAVEPDILDSEIPIPYEVWEHHQGGYFLQVEGSCMNRVYPEGCYVFIDPDMTPQDGSIAVSSIDETDYIMRRLHMGATTMILSPESFDEQWEDLIITRDSGKTVSFKGVVVWYQPQEEMD